MAHFKLTLDEDFEDSFELVAIHCSVEDFRMAYLLNREAHIKLERCESDLDFNRRSEEHTSELQSRPHLVCRLLLEKKKLNNISKDLFSELRKIYMEFTTEAALWLKNTEKTTNHAVQEFDYFLTPKLDQLNLSEYQA